MKMSIVFFMLLLPMSVFAQDMDGMNEQMMQQMQGMQACMQNIDQAEMQAIEQRSKQMEVEVQALCAEGKRNEALEKAAAFGKEVANNQAMQEMSKCGEGMKNMMPKIAMDAQNADGGETARHICDEQ